MTTLDPVYGARPLKRALSEVVEDKVLEGLNVSFDVVDGEIKVRVS